MPAPTDSELTRLAGPTAFKRGQTYFREERVSLLRVDCDGFEAQAEGSETYRLTLLRENRKWIGECSCPVDGFCKHLVAACLLWRDGQAAPVRYELAEFLRAQPAERLANWLLDLARDDRAVEKRLKLLASRGQPEQMRKSLGEMLTAQGFLDHQRSNDYARRLSVPLRELSLLLAEDPGQCHELCDYALQRLLTIVERADDSSGAIQDRIHAVANLYCRAATSAPALDRRRMAKSLHVNEKPRTAGLFYVCREGRARA